MLDTLVTGSKLTAIANAIRTAGGTSSTMTLDEMPTAIGNISGGSDFSDILTQIATGEGLFSGATATVLDLSNFDIPNVQFMTNFLYYATSSKIILPKSTISKTIEAYQMVAYCSNLTTLDTTGFSLPNATKISKMFQNDPLLENIDCSFLTANLTSATYLFSGCTSLKSVNLCNISTSAMRSSGWTDFFYNCNSLEAVVWATNKSTVQPLSATTSTLGVKSQMIFYVPDALVADYQAATNWSVIASQIKGVSELPAEYKTLYGIS